MTQYFSGLRARLLLLVLIALVPPFALDAYTAIYERRQAALTAERDAKNLVQLAAREHQRLLQSTRQYLVSVSKLPEVKNPSSYEACHRTLAEVHGPFSYYRLVGLALADGTVFCRSLPIRTKVNITDRGYFQRAVLTRSFGIGDYQIGRATLKPSINFGQAVLDDKGEVRAVVFAALDLDWLNELLSEHHLPPQSSMEVIDNDGTILARHPNPEAWLGKTPADSDLIGTILKHRTGGTIELRGLDKVRRVYAYAPLHDSPAGTAYIAVGLSTDVAFAAANSNFIRSIVSLLVVSIVAFSLVWWIGDRFVLRRVKALASAAKRIGDGDLSARTGLPHGTEEIGQLADTFDKMAQGLELMTVVRERVHRALETLSACNRAMIGAADEPTLLDSMCDTIVRVGGYRYAWIGYADHTPDKMIRTASHCGTEQTSDWLSSALIDSTWADTQQGQGLIATAIRTIKPQASHDLSLVFNREEAATSNGIGSAIAFPLAIQGKVVGALLICAPEADAFNTEEHKLLHQAAQDIAVAISVLRTRVEHDQVLEYMAYYDALTGLPNRLMVEKLLRRAMAEAGRTGRSLALAIIDVNRLWEINDAVGFHQGDQLLKEIANRIKPLFRGDMTVARMRGDEFSVLLPSTTAEQALKAVQDVQNVLKEPFIIGDLNLEISAVIGVSLYPQHGKDAPQIIRHADVAMHQAKKSGKPYAFYTAEDDEDYAKRLALISELRQAIASKQLVLHYQPKMRMSDGSICGMEALVRWNHPTRGMVPPDEFISIAEQTGLIAPLTDLVLRMAMQQCVQWRSAGLQVPVAINLSARLLRDLDLPEKIRRVLNEHRAHGSWLEIEITEGGVMEEPERALDILTQLSKMGIALFIDDFGTGYSSLAYLKKLPVDAVKIDKSFVIDMLDQDDSSKIVRSTIALAHDLGLKVVAEGVEDQATLDVLGTLQCDVAQGFLLSRPVATEHIAALLRKFPWVAKRPRARNQ